MKLYFIENNTNVIDEIVYECRCPNLNKIYLVVQGTHPELNNIAKHIVDIDTRVFDKTDPKESQYIRTCVQNILKGNMNDLLLG